MHRVTPVHLGARLAWRRAEHRWRTSAPLRDFATRQIRLFFGQTDLDDVEAVARGYVYETLKREELGFRPHVTTRLRVQGLDLLRDAHSRGGVLLSFMHHGQYTGTTPSIARHGFVIGQPVHPHFFRLDEVPRRALRLARDLDTMNLPANVELFEAPGSYPAMRDRLERGGIVAMASDVPGTGLATFLGREVAAPTGAARLAVETGVPVLPVTAHRAGVLQYLTIEEPLRPDRLDVDTVHRELFRRHETAVRAWPEAVERPLFRFAAATGDVADLFGPELTSYASWFPL